jgi:hypothetical protein
MVNAVPGFTTAEGHQRLLGLFAGVFGDAGRHARSAVGNVMLPNQISVEIEGIVAVRWRNLRMPTSSLGLGYAVIRPADAEQHLSKRN